MLAAPSMIVAGISVMVVGAGHQPDQGVQGLPPIATGVAAILATSPMELSIVHECGGATRFRVGRADTKSCVYPDVLQSIENLGNALTAHRAFSL